MKDLRTIQDYFWGKISFYFTIRLPRLYYLNFKYLQGSELGWIFCSSQTSVSTKNCVICLRNLGVIFFSGGERSWGYTGSAYSWLCSQGWCLVSGAQETIGDVQNSNQVYWVQGKYNLLYYLIFFVLLVIFAMFFEGGWEGRYQRLYPGPNTYKGCTYCCSPRPSKNVRILFFTFF